MVQGLEKLIGKRIKELRNFHNMSLRALSERCGLSANAISLIERGENSATISSLDKISKALNISIDNLFHKDQDESVLHLKNGQGLKKKTANFEIQSLGFGFKNQQIDPLHITIFPSEDKSPRLLSHPGQEFVYCLSGEIDYYIQSHSYHIAAGDSLLFEAIHPHGWVSPQKDKAILLIVFQCLLDPGNIRQCHIDLNVKDKAILS